MTTLSTSQPDIVTYPRFHRVFFNFDIPDDLSTPLVPSGSRALPADQLKSADTTNGGGRNYVLAQLASIVGPGVTGAQGIIIPAIPSQAEVVPESGSVWLVVKCMTIAILTILIVTLNTTMIWTLLKNRSSMHLDLYNYYNLSIAVADLLVGLLVTPLSIYPAYAGFWVYGNLACKFTSYLQVVVWIVIWCHFMWIGADRYLAIRKPYKYENGGSRKTRYKCWIAFSWLTAALITSPHLYGYKWSKYDQDSGLCGLDWRLMTAYSLTVGVLIMVPTFCTLSFTYYSIFRKIGSQYHLQREALEKRHQIASAVRSSLVVSQESLTFKEKICCWIPWELCPAANQKSKTVGRHSSVCPCEPVIVDGSGKPLRKKSNQSIMQPHILSVAGTGNVGSAKPQSIKPALPPLKIPVIVPSTPGVKTRISSTTHSPSNKSMSPGGKKSANAFFDETTYLAGSGASFDNSSYLLSFINMVLFMLSWIPWIALKIHSILNSERSTHGGFGYGLGSTKYPKNTPLIGGSVSNVSAYTYSVHNLHHPTLEFIFCWIVISNSMWKPILYFLLDKKFRALVIGLFTGKISSAFGKA